MVRPAVVALLLITLAPPWAWALTPVPLFGTQEFRANSLAALPQWEHVLKEIGEESRVYAACAQDSDACPDRAALAWDAHLKSLVGLDEADQIRRVNRFINHWRPAWADAVACDMDGNWSPPLRFLRSEGSCADAAIAKYVSLRRLGFPAGRLRLVVVHDRLRDVRRTVLAVWTEDDVLVLDSLNDATLSQQRISQYTPYYSVNENSRWTHAPARIEQLSFSSDLPFDTGQP
ncbi:MAG: transglutaminase-like cysteine peptidase [Geminicoccaceae bacterium]|nr:transglutaminase-like cysteine peptidase [Geminicoccaceae bacterium]